jgi:ankyrin repeat protein
VSLTKALIKAHEDDLDVNYQDGMGMSGVHYIAKGNHPEVLEVLLERYPTSGEDVKVKLNLSLQSNTGDTPAHLAVQLGHIALVRLLPVFGPRVVWFVFCLSPSFSHVLWMKQQLTLMIEHGADCGLKNERGVKPEAYAKDAEVRRLIHSSNVALRMDGKAHARDKPEDETIEKEKPVESLPVHVMKAELDPDVRFSRFPPILVSER